MENMNWQEIVRTGKEEEQTNVHNQLASEVWSFLKALAEKEVFQNIDFGIEISFEHSNFNSKAEFNVALNTRRCDQSTNNRISTNYRSVYKDGKKMGSDETLDMPCTCSSSQTS